MRKGPLSSIKLLVIDLDNTLCDTFHTLSKMQWEKALAVLQRDGVERKTILRMRRQLGRHSFRSAVQRLDKRRQRLAIRAYDDVDVRTLRLYGDAMALLRLPLPKVLVTRGERRLQREKIHHLGIRRFFRRVYHVPTFDQKRSAFRKVLKDFRLEPHEALVIGDRIEEEIKDAKSLRIPTAFIDRPGWPSHPSAAKPDLTVKSLAYIAQHLKEERKGTR
jgi:FMN phosphatase YigB (HAD superfamily)